MVRRADGWMGGRVAARERGREDESMRARVGSESERAKEDESIYAFAGRTAILGCICHQHVPRNEPR